MDWDNGKELKDLISEGEAIQQRMSSKKKSREEKHYKKWDRFIKLMEKGKISAALRSIGSQASSVLDIKDIVEDQDKAKSLARKRLS